MANEDGLRDITAKKIYSTFVETVPPPKVESKWPLRDHEGFDWPSSWRRLSHKVHDTVSRDVMFCLLHNILPTRERLARMKLAEDGFLSKREGYDGCGRASVLWD